MRSVSYCNKATLLVLYNMFKKLAVIDNYFLAQAPNQLLSEFRFATKQTLADNWRISQCIALLYEHIMQLSATLLQSSASDVTANRRYYLKVSEIICEPTCIQLLSNYNRDS